MTDFVNWNNKEEVLEAVKNNSRALQGRALLYASKELKADKDLVMTAIRFGTNIRYASEELRADKEVVLAAIKKRGDALEYASQELKGDKNMVMTAIKWNGGALCHASEELRADKEVVLAAIGENKERMAHCPDALQFASKELRADKEVVLAAVKGGSDGWLLEYVSKELRADKELVLDAIGSYSPDALRFASKELRADKEVVLAALTCDTDYDCLNWVRDYDWKEDFAMFSNDKDVALEIYRWINQDLFIDFLEFLGPKLNEDEDFLDDIYCSMASDLFSVYDDSIEEYLEQLDVVLDSRFKLDSSSQKNYQHLPLTNQNNKLLSERQTLENHFSGLREAIRERKPLEEQEQKIREMYQEKQTRIKEETEKLKSSQGELF